MKDAPSNMEKIGGFLLDSRSSLLYDKLKNFNLLERNASDLILMTPLHTPYSGAVVQLREGIKTIPFGNISPLLSQHDSSSMNFN